MIRVHLILKTIHQFISSSDQSFFTDEYNQLCVLSSNLELICPQSPVVHVPIHTHCFIGIYAYYTLNGLLVFLLLLGTKFERNVWAPLKQDSSV